MGRVERAERATEWGGYRGRPSGEGRGQRGQLSAERATEWGGQWGGQRGRPSGEGREGDRGRPSGEGRGGN